MTAEKLKHLFKLQKEIHRLQGMIENIDADGSKIEITVSRGSTQYVELSADAFRRVVEIIRADISDRLAQKTEEFEKA